MSDLPPYPSEAPAAGTIPALLLSACRWKANEPFLCEGALRLTGAEALARIARVQDQLAAHGIAHGSTVALLGPSSVAMAMILFAAIGLGAKCCFLHAYEREEHNADVLRLIEADLLVAGADEAHRDRAARIAGAAAVSFAVAGADAAAVTFAGKPGNRSRSRAAIEPDNPAMLLLSSGTTGRPKAILHTHRSLVAMAAAGVAVYGRCGGDDSVAVGMPPSFAAWIFTALPFLAARARLCFSPWTGPADYLSLLARERITVAALVPTVWRMVLASGPERHDLSAIRVAFFSGEPGSPSLVEALSRIAPDVRSAYLASEIGCGCGIAAGIGILSQPGKAASVGRPVPGGDLRVVDPERQALTDVAPGETGEIVLRGSSLAAGYWKNDKLTRERFVDGWWRTGDLGLVDGDGDVFIKGRIDNRINSGGIKIHAEEVEAALLTHPDIAMAAVVGEADPQWGERVVAHVVTRGDLSAEAIIVHCAAAGGLSGRKLPKAVYFHERLPTGPTNKLYRQALRVKGERSDAQ